MPPQRDEPLIALAPESDPDAEVRPVVRIALQIGWPAFVMAGVIETLVFAVVDPGGLHWFGGARIDWSAQAIYTVSFFIFWLVIATAGCISRALMTRKRDVRIEP